MNEIKNNSCIHCGAGCGKSPIKWNNNIFCCNGCKAVYQILNDNKLYKYYDLENSPGIKVENSQFDNKYDFLEHKEIIEKLILFKEGNISKVRFFIPVIHCASCIWLLENLQSLNKGIKFSHVNFTKKEVDITFNTDEISLKQLVELLSSIHYIPDLSISLSDKTTDASTYKKLLYKIGVAGFVFINVMTYSLPAYFNGSPLDEKLQNLFSILSYILIIPVVFYSGNDYYITAYKNIIKKNISIDLPIALGIIVLFIVTSYEVIFTGSNGYSDSLSGLIFFLLVGKWYQSKTYSALSFDRNYKSYFPIAVTRINKQIEESILIENVEVDDELIIRNSELIPADSILLEGNGQVDYSFVTGESNPVIKNNGDFLYAGGRQMSGIIKIKVKNRVNQSHLTQLWNQDKTYEKPSGSIKTLSDRISKYFTLTIIAIAISGALYWIINGEYETAVYVFTAVLIVACPCALALSIPFTFGNTMRIFGKAGLYIKNSDIIEKLSRIDTIIFDKTGTITKPGENQVEYIGVELSETDKFSIASLAKQSTHPLSLSVAKYFNYTDYSNVENFVEVAGRGVNGKVNNKFILLGSEEYVTNSDSPSKQNSSAVYVSINNNVAGYFKINNKYREGFNEVVTSIKKKYDLFMISGDNDYEKRILTPYFGKDNLYFNQKPIDKANFVKNLQYKGRNILMTGDGLNDAGALQQSDVSLSIANKAYHFSPASDAILEADKFNEFGEFIDFTKKSLTIVKLSFLISFLYNIIGIGFALSGNLSPIIAAILMPASSVSVIAFATFSTYLMAQLKLNYN